jgi:TonB-dependent receptor
MNGSVKAGFKQRRLDRRNDEGQHGRAGLQYGSGAGNMNTPFDQIAEQLPDWNLMSIIGTEGGLPISRVLTDYTRDNFLDGDYQLGFAYNEDDMLTLTRALQATVAAHGDQAEYRNNSIGSRGRDYDGRERTTAWYIMSEMNLGSMVTFIPGIRWERDYSKYHGQSFREVNNAWQDQAPSDLDTLTTKREFTFALPMIHLQVKPTDWLKVRMAYTKTLTRPDYMQYAPITRIDAFRSSINAANSGLKPALSTNYDIGMSVYQSHVGLLTVNGFMKEINDLILSISVPLHSDIMNVLPVSLHVPASWLAGATPNLYSQINNPFKTKYRGFEVDWQTNFWYLPSAFKGLVLNANYTYIWSETTYHTYAVVDNLDSIKTNRPRTYWKKLVETRRVGRMPDQPTHIANVTLGYDLKGFSARLSFLFQTDKSTNIDALRPILDTFTDDYFRLDLTLKQKINQHIELYSNFNNMNSRPDRIIVSSNSSLPSYLEYYGFTMDLGARYHF